ncbi:hypothetical protein AB1284_25070 [Bacillus sp. S2(2024)]|uniref:hypothetical protein n=1 Tax=Bacillus sp. S2(2024) TaxID=3162887 RepID=UPI003D22E078
MPCNSNQATFSLCTDANYYKSGATSVDVSCTYYGGGIIGGAPNWAYTFYLQYWTGSYWMNKTSASGSFNYPTPTKALSLSGCGAGQYRVSMVYYSQTNASYNGTVNTYSFQVDR